MRNFEPAGQLVMLGAEHSFVFSAPGWAWQKKCRSIRFGRKARSSKYSGGFPLPQVPKKATFFPWSSDKKSRNYLLALGIILGKHAEVQNKDEEEGNAV